MKPDELVRKARDRAWILAHLQCLTDANLLRDLADTLEESQKELQQVKGEVPCPDCLGGGAQADSAPTEPFECKKDWGWRKCSACKGSGKKYNTE